MAEPLHKTAGSVHTRGGKRMDSKEQERLSGQRCLLPFGDNIERAHRSGVEYVAQAGGSIRDDNVIATCDKYGIVMAMTGVRLFHH